jgi:hypothetical protein
MTHISRVKDWYVGEYSEIDTFHYMIRDGSGAAVAKVMHASDAQLIVEAVWRRACTEEDVA